MGAQQPLLFLAPESCCLKSCDVQAKAHLFSSVLRLCFYLVWRVLIYIAFPMI